jgi:curli biogenesis system outer membrane secretion channel CsgG
LLGLGLAPLAHAEDELLDFDEPPRNLAKPIKSIENGCTQFITKKLKKKIGQNFKPNGDEFWMQTGQAQISGSVGGENYINERMNAYEKAVLDAKRKILAGMKVEVAREVSYQLLGPEQKAELKATAPAADKQKIAEYEDKRDFNSAVKKGLELLNRDLDAKLKETEPAALEPAPKSLDQAVEQKKRKVGERFSDTINASAMSQLYGIRRVFVLDNSPKGSDIKGTVCVAVVYSDTTRRIADAMHAQDPSLLPATNQPGPPLAMQIPDKSTREGVHALVTTMGVDSRVDENGDYWLISYAIAGSEVDGNTTARLAARQMAYERARAGLRTYMGEIATMKSLTDLKSKSDVFGKGDEAYTFNTNFDYQVKSESKSASLVGVVDGGDFAAYHPETGNDVIGAYVMWSSSTMAGAKKEFKKNNKPRPQPTDNMTPNTGTNGQAAPAPMAVGGSSGGVTKSACADGDSYRFTIQTVEGTGVGETTHQATLQALQTAVSKVNGLAIAAQTQTDIQSVSSGDKDSSNYAFSNAFQQSISTATKGVIRCWDVIESKQSATVAGAQEVRLLVTVTKYKSDPSLNLPRVAVADFLLSPVTQKSTKGRTVASSVPRRIMDFLGNSQKFAMIDRQYMDLTQAELSLVTGDGFQLEELARLGNRVGTDYLIVGTVTAAKEWVETRTMKSTGKVFRRVNSDVSVSIRMVDVATSQVVYAGEPSYRGAHSLKTTMGYIIRLAGANIVNSLYPNTMAVPKPPVNQKTSVKDVQKFGKKALNELKKENQDDW